MASQSTGTLAVLRDYAVRTAFYVRGQVQAMRVRPTWQRSHQWFTFGDLDDLNEFRIGSDADIGGHSRCYWGLTDRKTALFWGSLSANADVTALRSGYAGITSKWRPKTALHRPTFYIAPFRYLEIEAKGDHHTWFVNLQTGEPGMPVRLWQQKVRFRTPGQFEVLQLDFANFVHTIGSENHPKPNRMNTNIAQFGMSILHQPGDFALEIRSVRAVNTIRSWGFSDSVMIDEYYDETGVLRKGSVKNMNARNENGADKDDKLDLQVGPIYQDPEQAKIDKMNKAQGKVDVFDADLTRLMFEDAAATETISKSSSSTSSSSSTDPPIQESSKSNSTNDSSSTVKR